jgi:ubiquinone/menaquinone biosynthesis C-methylase UbiE
MDPRLQRRVQRYGWDLAVATYEQGWHAQLAPAHELMLEIANLRQGECVLDVACGTGLVTLRAAEAVGADGAVVGTDLSGEMVAATERAAARRGLGQVRVQRADAEDLPFADGSFDVVLCGLGLMYVPDPARSLHEIGRVLRPGGRAAMAVWGARRACGWAEIFSITDARVASDVCPMFFHLGTGDTLAHILGAAGFADVHVQRIGTTLHYASAELALAAAFRGGPVALAYSRFDAATRAAVHAEYLQSIAAFAAGDGYRIPGEFVVAGARHSASITRQDREFADAYH